VILVIAEQRDGTLNRATWEAIAAAQQLASTAQQLAGTTPIAVAVLGAATGNVPQDLATAFVAEVLVAEHAALDPYTPDAYVAAVSALIEAAKPSVVLLPHTYQTRDFAPLLAARLRKPLITDVTGINGTGADATFVRPMFQGKLAAQVKPQGATPALVTIQIGAFRADAARKGGSAAIRNIQVNIDPATITPKPQICFIDGEHTDSACVSDSRFCSMVMDHNGLLVFHDACVVYSGLATIVESLNTRSMSFHAYNLPDVLFVIESGDCAIHKFRCIEELLIDNHLGYLSSLQRNDGYRHFANRTPFRLLRSLKEGVTRATSFR